MRINNYFLPILVLVAIVGYSFTNSQLSIEGYVLDSTTNAAISGANIVDLETNESTKTDKNGHFTLSVENKEAILAISFSGYETKEIAIENLDYKKIEIHLKAIQPIITQEAVRNNKKISFADLAENSSSAQMPWVKSTVPAAHAQYEPTDLSTEDYTLIQENRFHRATDQPVSTFSIDVDAASYSNLRRFINNGQAPPKDAVRIEEMINYFEYEYQEPNDGKPFSVHTEYADCPWKKDHKLLHIGLQGKRIPSEDLPASNLVFLIDVSGSMQAANKLPLLKSSLKMLVDNLRANDRVAIAVYAGAAGLALESTLGSEKQKIKDAIDELEAGGSTAGAAGIKLAYQTASKFLKKGNNNRVIIATDGDFNVGVSSDAELARMIEEERESGVFLTVLGFGMGNYKDNKMQELANKGNGNHAYIDNISEARKVLVNEFGGTMYTIAKDVKMQIEFNPEKIEGYRLIGYENRMLQREDFNDDKKDAGELGSGHTVTALYEIIPKGVESDFLASVDELKYQKNATMRKSEYGKELMHLKLRFKKPTSNKSELVEKAILDSNYSFKNTSTNFQWAAATASFGMLLRDSEFKSNMNYSDAIQWAKEAKGKDEKGYRAEMIRLMEFMRSSEDTQVVKKEKD